MLTTAQKAKSIIQLLQSREYKAHEEVIRMRIEIAGWEAMDQAYRREEERGDIGFSTNPYPIKIEAATERLNAHTEYWQDVRAVLEFANDHFLDMLDK